MSNPKDRSNSDALDDKTLALVGESLAPEVMPKERKMALFSKIVARVDQQSSDQNPSHVTMRAGEGEWISIMPKIEKKILFVDMKRRIEAYLLRAQPGAELPAHQHEADEYCMVLEGDVSFDDLDLVAGDFHFARQGSSHSVARSRGGALVYLESAI